MKFQMDLLRGTGTCKRLRSPEVPAGALQGSAEQSPADESFLFLLTHRAFYLLL